MPVRHPVLRLTRMVAVSSECQWLDQKAAHLALRIGAKEPEQQLAMLVAGGAYMQTLLALAAAVGTAVFESTDDTATTVSLLARNKTGLRTPPIHCWSGRRVLSFPQYLPADTAVSTTDSHSAKNRSAICAPLRHSQLRQVVLSCAP